MISTIRELKNNSEVYVPCNYSDLVKESIHLPDVCIGRRYRKYLFGGDEEVGGTASLNLKEN
jgi:hypothetical protein